MTGMLHMMLEKGNKHLKYSLHDSKENIAYIVCRRAWQAVYDLSNYAMKTILKKTRGLSGSESNLQEQNAFDEPAAISTETKQDMRKYFKKLDKLTSIVPEVMDASVLVLATLPNSERVYKLSLG